MKKQNKAYNKTQTKTKLKQESETQSNIQKSEHIVADKINNDQILSEMEEKWKEKSITTEKSLNLKNYKILR